MPEPASKTLVVHADDLGLCHEFNEGIRRAATNGFLTSTCLRTNGKAFTAAVQEVLPACPHLGVGVHLNIVEGRSTQPSIARTSELHDARGWYRYGFAGLLQAARRPRLLREIEAEFRHQIETVLQHRPVDHLNGHQHCHAIPALFEIACRLANEYRIPFIRIPQERVALARGDYPWAGIAVNVAKVAMVTAFVPRLRVLAARHGVSTNALFVGLLYTGFMDPHSVIAGLKQAATAASGPVELLVHPCADLGRTREHYWPGVRDYVINTHRSRELAILTDPSVESLLRKDGWELTNYARLAGWSLPAPRREPRPAPRKKLRVVAILDETPFYQHDYFRRLVMESQYAEIVAVAPVVPEGGGILQRYRLRNRHRLALHELGWLGLKSTAFKVKGMLPRFVRGTHEGSVQNVARRLGIPCRTINSVRTDEFHDWVRCFEPDVILSSNSLSFPESLIRLPRLVTIHRHSAPLPGSGGSLSAFRAVQNAEPAIGVSVHVMTKSIDEGPVIARRWIPIEAGDTFDTLNRLAFVVSFDATEDAFARILEHHGAPPPLPV